MFRRPRVIYSPDARKDLHALDRQVARRIVVKVNDNAALRNPLVRARALTGALAGRYRYRVGDYRVIFSIDRDNRERISILKILRIKHRSDVY